MTTASPDPDPDLGVARCNRSSVQLLGSWLTLQANGIDALRAVDAHKLVAELGYPTRGAGSRPAHLKIWVPSS